MTFRKKRKVILASVILLLILLILDIWFYREEVVAEFGEQFENEQRTDEYEEAHKALTKTVQKQLEIERASVNELSLVNTRGDIAVARAEGNTIRLEYAVTHTDHKGSDRELNEVIVEQITNNGKLSLISSLESKRANSSSLSIDYVLFVPDGMKLWIESEDGSVLIDGTVGDIDAKSYNGLMEIVNVEGNLKVNKTYHQLFVSDIKGNVELETQLSDTDIEHIEGEIVIDSEQGDHFIIGISDGVTATSYSGTVHLRDIGGPVEVKSHQSEVQLAHIRNDIQVEAKSEDISLILSESEGYTVDAKVTYGSIRTHLPFQIEEVSKTDETHMSGVIGSGAWQVNLDISQARLTIHASK